MCSTSLIRNKLCKKVYTVLFILLYGLISTHAAISNRSNKSLGEWWSRWKRLKLIFHSFAHAPSKLFNLMRWGNFSSTRCWIIEQGKLIRMFFLPLALNGLSGFFPDVNKLFTCKNHQKISEPSIWYRLRQLTSIWVQQRQGEFFST